MPGYARTPGRFCDSKTPPRSRHTATDTPSWQGQMGEHRGFHPHRVHRNGSTPTWAPYPARRRPNRPQAVWLPGYEPLAGSALAPKADTFSYRARSSAVSGCLRDKRLDSREESLSPFMRLTATIDWDTGAFSDSLLVVSIVKSTVRAANRSGLGRLNRPIFLD